MISRRNFAEIAIGGAGLVFLGGCGAQNPYKFRARVTVSVDTPTGVRSGSGVYEIWANWSYPGTTRRIWGERGEAIAVDLPNGQTLLSLLKTGGIHGDIASMVLAALDENFNNTMVESTQKISHWTGSDPTPIAPTRVEERYDKGVLIVEELSNYPLLVTFKDIDDPTSVYLVEPDDLAAHFGEGYWLNAITVQVTNEVVSDRIEQKLVWLIDEDRKLFKPKEQPEGIPLGNYRGLFSSKFS